MECWGSVHASPSEGVDQCNIRQVKFEIQHLEIKRIDCFKKCMVPNPLINKYANTIPVTPENRKEILSNFGESCNECFQIEEKLSNNIEALNGLKGEYNYYSGAVNYGERSKDEVLRDMNEVDDNITGLMVDRIECFNKCMRNNH